MTAKVWTLILAAGESRRFGSAKALASWRDGTLLSHALETARLTSGGRTLVVTGGHSESVASYLEQVEKGSSDVGRTALAMFNPRWPEGMGTSIARGVDAVLARDPEASAILILPVDQPGVTSQHLRKLAGLAKRQGDLRCVLTRATSADAHEFTGPPAYIPRAFFDRARELRGDRGLKSLLGSEEILAVTDAHAAMDVDTPEALGQLSGASTCMNLRRP